MAVPRAEFLLAILFGAVPRAEFLRAIPLKLFRVQNSFAQFCLELFRVRNSFAQFCLELFCVQNSFAQFRWGCSACRIAVPVFASRRLPPRASCPPDHSSVLTGSAASPSAAERMLPFTSSLITRPSRSMMLRLE